MIYFLFVDRGMDFKINEDAKHFQWIRGILKHTNSKDTIGANKLNNEKHKSIIRKKRSIEKKKQCCCLPVNVRVPAYITNKYFNDTLKRLRFIHFND